MTSVFDNVQPDTLWGHLVECWAHGFGYDQAVSYYGFTFSQRLFETAMQACDDDYDAYMFEKDRELWRRSKIVTLG